MSEHATEKWIDPQGYTWTREEWHAHHDEMVASPDYLDAVAADPSVALHREPEDEPTLECAPATCAAEALRAIRGYESQGHADAEDDVYNVAIAPFGVRDDLGPEDQTAHIFGDWSGIEWDPSTREWCEMNGRAVAEMVADARTREIEIYLAGDADHLVEELAMTSPEGPEGMTGRVVLVVEPHPHLVMCVPAADRMPDEATDVPEAEAPAA